MLLSSTRPKEPEAAPFGELLVPRVVKGGEGVTLTYGFSWWCTESKHGKWIGGNMWEWNVGLRPRLMARICLQAAAINSTSYCWGESRKWLPQNFIQMHSQVCSFGVAFDLILFSVWPSLQRCQGIPKLIQRSNFPSIARPATAPFAITSGWICRIQNMHFFLQNWNQTRGLWSFNSLAVLVELGRDLCRARICFKRRPRAEQGRQGSSANAPGPTPPRNRPRKPH